MGRKTVIIAGAGTSVEFGLPSGEAILSALQTYKRVSLRHDSGDGPSFQEQLENFDLFMGAGSNHLHNDFPGFHTAVAGSSVRSIDLFANHRPGYVALGKLWSVRCLYQHMQQAEQLCRTRTFQFRKDTNYPNWLMGACRLYYDGRPRIDQLDRETLTFVTFNYDTLIEQGMAAFLEHSFPSIKESGRLPRVIHVHGSFSELPSAVTIRDVFDEHRAIRFVHETEEQSHSLKQISFAQNALAAASAIYCVGFAFNEANCNLLNLRSYADKIVALNYDGRRGLHQSIAELGVPARQIISGSASNPLGVGRAVEQEDLFEVL